MIDERGIILKALKEGIELLSYREAMKVRKDYTLYLERKIYGRYEMLCELAGINKKKFLKKIEKVHPTAIHEGALDWINIPF